MGAWDYYTTAAGYRTRFFRETRPITKFSSSSRFGIAVISFKNELEYNGFDVAEFNPSLPWIGDQAKQAIEEAQRAGGLAVDGIAGPATLKYVCKARIITTERSSLIPNDLLCKVIGIESDFDPAAQGTVDPKDRGLGQINSDAHPNITDEQAYSIDFAIPWMGNALKSSLAALGDEQAGVAAYNVGTGGATKWLDAGKPTSGGPQIGTNLDGSPRYLYTTAHEYVQAVYNFSC